MAAQEQTKLAEDVSEMAAQEQTNLAKEKSKMIAQDQIKTAGAYFAVYFTQQGIMVDVKGPNPSINPAEINAAISGDLLPRHGIAEQEIGETVSIQNGKKTSGLDKADSDRSIIPIYLELRKNYSTGGFCVVQNGVQHCF